MAQAQRIKPKSEQPAIRLGLFRFFNGIVRHISFALMLMVALGMVGALLSFDQRDPAWTHTAEVAQLHNFGGRIGAWFADVALYFFGYPAALLPLGVAFAGWRLFQRRALLDLDAEIVLFRVMGFAVALATACSLAALHLSVFPGTLPGDHAPGGLLGVYVSRFLVQAFGFTGGNLFMVGLLLAGLMLMTGISWLTMIDVLGAVLLKILDAAGWLVMAPLTWLTQQRERPTDEQVANTEEYAEEERTVQPRDAGNAHAQPAGSPTLHFPESIPMTATPAEEYAAHNAGLAQGKSALTAWTRSARRKIEQLLAQPDVADEQTIRVDERSQQPNIAKQARRAAPAVIDTTLIPTATPSSMSGKLPSGSSDKTRS